MRFFTPPCAVRRSLVGFCACLIVLAAGPAPRARGAAVAANDGFNPNVTGTVGVLAVQANGQIVLGGIFTSLQPNGSASPILRSNIARVNADGSLDTGFDPEATGGAVLALAVQSDGKILMGGAFRSLRPNGASTPTSISYLARLNSDGSVDTSFNPNPSGTYGGNVTAIAVQSDGKILIGGYFTTLQPAGVILARPRPIILARLNADGSIDTTFEPANPNAPVDAIVIEPNGQILIGGTFLTVQPSGAATATVRNHVARFNVDGSLDTTFDPNAGNPGNLVTSFAVQSDGKILMGGYFTSLDPNGSTTSYTADCLARLNSDGTVDTTFTPQFSGGVNALAVLANGQILVAGRFSVVNYADGSSFSARYVLRLNPDATGDSSFVPGPNAPVNAVAVQPDGKMVLAGGFTQLTPVGAKSATTRNGMARVNFDGSLDADFDPNAHGGASAIAVQSDGKVILGGGFSSVGGLTRNNLARLATDGSVDTGFDPEPNGPVMAVAVQSRTARS